MDVRPILSTLARHKTAAALIVLEVALTCAIICNAVFLIGERLRRMDAPTGMAESELLHLTVSSIARVDNRDALTQQDLAALRAIPGVRAATITNQLPFDHNSSDTSVNLAPDQPQPTLSASAYITGEDFIETTGLRVVEGRAFLPEDYRLQSELEHDPHAQLPIAMVDRSLAQRLFPGRSAVGQSIYLLNDSPTRIVGVIDRLAPPAPGHGSEYVVMTPVRPSFRDGSYLVRVSDPAHKARVLREAAQALERIDHRRTVTQQTTLEELRHIYYQQDRWMTALLVAVCVALLVVTAFGIVGLASFWVQQRTRMIGVRRALGASRRQVRRYFQTENFLLTGIGIVFGMVGAYGINQVLMAHYELPRLPWGYLPVGALALWALGQVAVLGPAMRAAALPPVVVMRGA